MQDDFLKGKIVCSKCLKNKWSDAILIRRYLFEFILSFVLSFQSEIDSNLIEMKSKDLNLSSISNV